MPQPLTSPGVYVEEIPSGVRTIVGVETSVAAFVGYTARGPTNAARRIFNFGDYERLFGGPHADSDLSYAVQRSYGRMRPDGEVIAGMRQPRYCGGDVRGVDGSEADDDPELSFAELVGPAQRGEDHVLLGGGAQLGVRQVRDRHPHDQQLWEQDARGAVRVDRRCRGTAAPVVGRARAVRMTPRSRRRRNDAVETPARRGRDTLFVCMAAGQVGPPISGGYVVGRPSGEEHE